MVEYVILCIELRMLGDDILKNWKSIYLRPIEFQFSYINDQNENRLNEPYNKITIKNNTPETNSLTSPSKFSKSLKFKLHILPFVKETS